VAERVLDLRGSLITPGLVDLHTHCYWGATYWGIEPDPVAARTGVTTWVDAGSAGAYNFPAFRRYVHQSARVRALSFLNVSAVGLTAPTNELANPAYCDIEIGQLIVESNRDCIRGIKARVDRWTTGETGIEGLRRARALADRVKLPLMVHVATAPPHMPEIADFLRPGDILTHCFTGQDNRLVDAAGNVLPLARALRDRAVIFDIGHGGGSFSYDSAEALLAAGIKPDVISSDIHQLSRIGPMRDLPTTLSKFLNLGLSLDEVIACATVRPAAAIGESGIGTLSVGARADIAAFRLEEGPFTFHDCESQARQGTVRLVNTATFVAGKRLRRSAELPPAPWIEQVE
jgi:dihydroorotase